MKMEATNEFEEMVEEDICAAVAVLQSGGVILYPTDTVWGLGCDAGNDQAIKRIYDIKKRCDAKSFLSLVDSEQTLLRYVDPIPAVAQQILHKELPLCIDGEEHPFDRPITIVYPYARNVSPLLISSDGSLGIRITTEMFSKRLCKILGGAIVSTSANISGETTPRSFFQISESVKQSVDYVCKSKRDDKGIGQSSIIIKVDMMDNWHVIRK